MELRVDTRGSRSERLQEYYERDGERSRTEPTCFVVSRTLWVDAADVFLWFPFGLVIVCVGDAAVNTVFGCVCERHLLFLAVLYANERQVGLSLGEASCNAAAATTTTRGGGSSSGMFGEESFICSTQ